MKRKKLTKITAIVIGVLIGIPLIVVGFLLTQGAFTRASGAAPETINVVGVTDTSASITWTTGQDTQGVVLYGTTPLQLDRPVPETTPSTIHRVTIELLRPATTYYYVIRIGDTVFDDNGEPWSFTTLAASADNEATDEAGLGADGNATPSADTANGGDPDDLDIAIDFEDDDSLVFVISPTPGSTGASSGGSSDGGSGTTPGGVSSGGSSGAGGSSGSSGGSGGQSGSSGQQVIPTLRSSTPTPIPQPSNTPRPTFPTCPNTDDCDEIRDLFGRGCTSANYVSCLLGNVTPTPNPPAPPSDLEATVSGNDVTLSWTDQSEGETKFEIFRSTNDSTGFSRVATKNIDDDPGSGQEVSHVLNSQPSGTLYYRIFSFIENTRSRTPSDTASVTVP